MQRFAGKVALITGAARGQGEAEARLLVEEGARVVMGDILDERGQLAAEQLGDAAHYLHLDVTSEADWDHAISEVSDRWGRLDVLVNNAGIATANVPLADLSLDEYRRSIEINQIGVFLGMRAVIFLLTNDGGGAIVNISSTAGMRGKPGRFAYSSTKYAIRGMTQVAALELAPLGIRVNCVFPGAVATEMIFPDNGESRAASLEKHLERVPLRRPADA